MQIHINLESKKFRDSFSFLITHKNYCFEDIFRLIIENLIMNIMMLDFYYFKIIKYAVEEKF